jgi:uncharacterized damage-inducible protein DinB
MATHFERMWEFEAWANRRAMESIAQLSEQNVCACSATFSRPKELG